ncbi:AraC family transcriptional regulator [Pseudomonas sp. J237]|nr:MULTISPECIES: AraC family transcriptional regulator [Pseudomonas]OEO25670.1 AraC family transcriptional regulator [Pseudomonas sp. J237]
MSISKGTISIRLVNEALHEWQTAGHPVTALLERAGIASELLDKPFSRVTAKQYAQLWLALAQEMDDEFFGMNPRRMKVGSFAFLARTAVKEPTLEGALGEIVRFLRLVMDDFKVETQISGGMLELSVATAGEPPRRAFTYFTLWMIVHGLMCWLVGRRIAIIAIDLQCAKPDYIEDYRVMFSDNLRFNQPRSRLLLNTDCLDFAIRRTPEELSEFLHTSPQGILVRYRDSQSYAARIKAYLRGQKPDRWPDIEAVAAHFFISPATLRRKLAHEGQSFQSLKDHVRRDLAISRLNTGEQNYAELAYALGYADSSAFYKAFKKWTGTTPGQYCAMVFGSGEHG